jgi:hypothetical protein
MFAIAQVAACTPYYTRRAYMYRPAPYAHADQRYVHAPHAYGSGYYYDPYATDDDGNGRSDHVDRGYRARPAAHGPPPDHAHAPRPRARP